MPIALQCSVRPLTGQPACRCCTGTFAWIAPEVLMGGKQCSSAVDIYRCACQLSMKWQAQGQGRASCTLQEFRWLQPAQHGGELWVAISLCRPSVHVSVLCCQPASDLTAQAAPPLSRSFGVVMWEVSVI